MHESRWEPRQPCRGQYTLTWRGRDGKSYSTEAAGLDISSGGVGIECASELNAGSIVHVEARDGSLTADCEVVHCSRRGLKFRIGLELREEAKHKKEAPRERTRSDRESDHYEVLQISRKADAQTINRVYHMMAARFHPDNPETGDVEQFLRMKRAYAVLSDPGRRMEYDASLESGSHGGPRQIFALKDFVTGVKAEANRRLGVLSLLYNDRQTNPDLPGLSLLDLEQEMGFPREYLSFTMWYLLAKGFVAMEQNSDYSLTAAGADYVERKAGRNAIVVQLLHPGASRVQSPAPAYNGSAKGTSKPNQQFLLSAASVTPNV